MLERGIGCFFAIIIIMFSLQNIPFVLSLLLLPVICFLWVLIWKRKVKKKLGDSFLINQLTDNYSSFRYKLKFVIVMLCLSILGLSMAVTKYNSNENNIQSNGFDMVIAFDASRSMLSKDVTPSRIEKGKQLANELISTIGNNRAGLIVFAGEPFLQMPVTADLSAAGMFINNISVEDVPLGGTNITAALRLCDSALSLHERRRKIVVLISDGEDHDAYAEKEADRLRQDGINIFTIGVGTAAGSYIEDNGQYVKDNDGKFVTSKLNEPLLKNISAITGGEYFFLDDVNNVSGRITGILNDQNNKNSNDKLNKSVFHWIFLIPVLLLLIIECSIPEIKSGYNK